MGNVQDAEDMVQEAYLKLWKKRDELPEVASIEAYCVTLIKKFVLRFPPFLQTGRRQPTARRLNLPTDSNMVHEIEQKRRSESGKKINRTVAAATATNHPAA